jgi:hypothetical protein
VIFSQSKQKNSEIKTVIMIMLNLLRMASFLFLSAIIPLFLILFLSGYITNRDVNNFCKYLYKTFNFWHEIYSKILKFLSRKTRFVSRFLKSKFLILQQISCDVLLKFNGKNVNESDNRIKLDNKNENKMKSKTNNVLYNGDEVAEDENVLTDALQSSSRKNEEESECSLAGLTIDNVRTHIILFDTFKLIFLVIFPIYYYFLF